MNHTIRDNFNIRSSFNAKHSRCAMLRASGMIFFISRLATLAFASPNVRRAERKMISKDHAKRHRRLQINLEILLPSRPAIWQNLRMAANQQEQKAAQGGTCQHCGKASIASLCPRCDAKAKREIGHSISACEHLGNRVPCPKCHGSGHILGKVQTRHGLRYGKLFLVDGEVRCPHCAGSGKTSLSLPIPPELEVVPSDVGILKAKFGWRPMNKIGSIRGLPSFAGKAFATNGILVAIRKADGSVVIGHLGSFEELRERSEKPKRMTKLERLAAEFV